VIAGFGRPNYTPDNSSPWNPSSNVDWVKLRKFVAAALHNEIAGIVTVKPGMKNGQVAVVQKALNLVTGAALAEDGDFGPSTRAAVVSFQKFFKLSPDGVVGPKTKSMLQVCLAKIRDGA
jgi:peptidoglycan hydrolase-like protein with peptidoglycan-binding domain